MLKSIRNSIVLTFLLIPLLGIANPPQQKMKDRMLADLDIIKNTFEVMYAPSEWKKEYADWELETQINLAKVKILTHEDLSLKDYQRILKDFFNSTRDYHVGISFYSTEAAFLPFRVHSTNGKYYVAWVFSPLFSGLKDPMRKGDEVLLFNGRPIDDVVQELKKSDFGNPNSKTDQGLADEALSFRTGSSGNIVPKGPVSVTVRHAGTKQVTTYQLNWLYCPEEITCSLNAMLAAEECKIFQDAKTKGPQQHKTMPLGKHAFFHKDMTTPLYRHYKKGVLQRRQVLRSALDEEEDHFIGSKKSYIPDLGDIVWQEEDHSPFYAYIFQNDEGKYIGYIRIPHYAEGSHAVNKFSEIINYFENETDALVVDQVNNPGGFLFYMYALASLLSDKPLIVPKHKEAITQEDVYFAIENIDILMEVQTDQDAHHVLGNTIEGYPVDYDLAQDCLKYFRFLIDEWNDGHRFTSPASLFGLDSLKPHPRGSYSKPILLLVNHLDLSAADFFPAILQDNGRATLLGTRTAGAGGSVLSQNHPNLFGIEDYCLTGSLALRVDLNPIENLGVNPDIVVELTERDLEENYPDYVSEIHKAISDLLKN